MFNKPSFRVMGEKELYILAPDPDEMENRAAAASPDLLKAASAYLAALRGTIPLGTPGRFVAESMRSW